MNNSTNESEKSTLTVAATTEQIIRARYFLINKRGVVIGLSLVVLAYFCAIVCNEFVYSVTTAGAMADETSKAFKDVPCPTQEQAKRFLVNDTNVPKRKPWLFETQEIWAQYVDIYYAYPGCHALDLLNFVRADDRGLKVYYFDRNTNRPVASMTFQSLKQ